MYLKDIRERNLNRREHEHELHPFTIETHQTETYEELLLKFKGKVLRKVKFWPAHKRATFWERIGKREFSRSYTIRYISRFGVIELLGFYTQDPTPPIKEVAK